MKHELRAEVVATALRMNQAGLNQGTSGNVSARVEGGFLITPSARPYEDMRPTDVVEVNFDGRVVGGRLAPSTEWRMHRDVYLARPEAGAIVHAHAMFATTLSIVRMPIPAVHYMIAVTGADEVRCAPYATFGTAELAAAAVEALAGSRACLLANHGMLALGDTLAAAFRVAREVEVLAAQYWRALQVGKPHVLDAAQMAEVHERLKTYGR